MGNDWERVYTVHDWWDGPRVGFADFRGVPHAYRSIFRQDLDDWDPENRFELSPVEPSSLALALEDWAIWCRWEEALYAGETTDDTHPALPADRARHEEIAPLVYRALELDPGRRQTAAGEFRTLDDIRGGTSIPTSRAHFRVRWSQVVL